MYIYARGKASYSVFRYLYPLEKNANQQAQVASQLKELRNNVVFGLLMVNAIWILILVQLMTLQV